MHRHHGPAPLSPSLFSSIRQGRRCRSRTASRTLATAQTLAFVPVPALAVTPAAAASEQHRHRRAVCQRDSGYTIGGFLVLQEIMRCIADV